MPYIEQEKRKSLDIMIDVISEPHMDIGELNYTITRLIAKWCEPSPRYATYNSAIGVLECVKQEFYRRIVAPYENKKRRENGDVYD